MRDPTTRWTAGIRTTRATTRNKEDGMTLPRVCTLLAGAAAVGLIIAPVARAQETTVAKAEISDSFFNQCTGEVVNRTYTRHVTRKKDGNDYLLLVNWSAGKGVGQKTGDSYVLNWKYQQMHQSDEKPESDAGWFLYRIKTTVKARGSASDYSSDILIRIRTNEDGTVSYEEREATGIQCS